ncbi:MAG: tetratricopeptide repeat protein [Anaerolineae bacterium]
MGFFRRLSRLVTTSNAPQTVPRAVRMQELMKKAQHEHYNENYQAALTLLGEALELAQQEKQKRVEFDINLTRADIAIAIGDYESARFLLDELREDSEARQLHTPLAYTLCSLGVLAQVQGNLSEAQTYYEQAREIADKLKTDGALGRAMAHLGDIYLAQGNASYAIYLFEEALPRLDRSGDHELRGYFWGQLGLAQIASGQADAGYVHLRRGLDLALNSQNQAQIRTLSIQLGELALAQGNDPQAQMYFHKALSLYPEPPPNSTDYAHLLCQMSRLALRQGNWYQARQWSEQALTIATDQANERLVAMARATLGMAKHAEGKDDALTELEASAEAYQAYSDDPFYIVILRHLAREQVSQGDEAGAQATYQRALTRAKSFPIETAHIHSELAGLHAQQGDLRSAIQAWQDALIAFEASNQAEQMARAHCDLGAMYDQLGDGRMAQREYGKALEMLGRVDEDDTRGIVLANVAVAYSAYGDIESAEDFFKEALALAERTHNPSAQAVRRGNYGRLLALTNRPQQALTELMTAHRACLELDLLQEASVIDGSIGLAYALLGDPERAKTHYQTALDGLANTVQSAQWQAVIHADWGDTLLDRAFDEAIKHYQTAWHLAQENGLIDIRIQTLLGQAQIAMRRDDYDTAQHTLTQVETVAKRLNHRRLLAVLYQAWSQYHAHQGHSEQAQQAWEQASQLRAIMHMPECTADWL